VLADIRTVFATSFGFYNYHKMKDLRTITHTITDRYWGILVLLAWGAGLLFFGLIRFEPYGLDEGAARGLILNWSIADGVLNPIVTLGIPDFRALLFIPLGLYWSGSIIAAKVYTMLLAFLAVTLLYHWNMKHADRESAIIGCALLLVLPLFINQIDAIAIGIYLLLTFGVALSIDNRYRKIKRPLGGWYFIQLLWVGLTITMHPMGLAYPLALAWRWHKDPIDERQKQHLYIGLVLVVGTILIMRGGWQNVDWLVNPLLSLSQAFQAITHVTGSPNWFLGGIFAIALVYILWRDRRFLLSNLLGSILLFAIVIGLSAAESSWALLVITLVFLRGAYHLLRFNQAIGQVGLLRTRGIVIGMIFVISTASMIMDKNRIRAITELQVSQQDKLIRSLAQAAEDPDIPFQIASQWPGRTMIASKRHTFPLPPAEGKNSEEFLESITGITHLIFDPYDPDNEALARQIAVLAGYTKTAELNAEGVIVEVIPQRIDHAEGESGEPATTDKPAQPSTPSRNTSGEDQTS